MKKQIVAAVCTALLIGSAAGAGASYAVRKTIEVEYSGLTMRLNDRAVDTGGSEPFLVVSEGRTYIPARYLAEAMGGNVAWDPVARAVQVFTPDYVRRTGSRYELPFFGASIEVTGERLTHAVLDPSTQTSTLWVGGNGLTTLLQVEHWGAVGRPPIEITPSMMVAAAGEAAEEALMASEGALYGEVHLSEPTIVQVEGALAVADFTGTARTGDSMSGPNKTWTFALRVVVTPDSGYAVLVNDDGGAMGDTLPTVAQKIFESLRIGK